MKKVFVVGAARSGTNMLGHYINSHPDAVCTVEKKPTYDLVDSYALRTDDFDLDEAAEKIRRSYLEDQWRGLEAPVLADKTHSWVLRPELLYRAFPDAIVIRITRNPIDVVASMLKHPGVMAWFKREQYYSRLPSRWYGIQNATELALWRDFPDWKKCVWRLFSWENSWDTNNYPLSTVSYENMVKHSSASTTLSTITGLDSNGFDGSLLYRGSIGNGTTGLPEDIQRSIIKELARLKTWRRHQHD